MGIVKNMECEMEWNISCVAFVAYTNHVAYTKQNMTYTKQKPK